VARTGVSVSAVVAWAVAVVGFGVLHYSANRWLLDGAGGSLRDTLVTTALWAVFFGLVMWWSQRRAGRRG
jgi:Zn-dependent protease with chaperone function